MEQKVRKPKHYHKGNRTIESAYIACIGMACNADAHNGNKLIETCECGSYRYINNNRGVNEYGTWLFKREW